MSQNELKLNSPIKLLYKIAKFIIGIFPKSIQNKIALKRKGVIFINKRKIIRNIDKLRALPKLDNGKSPKLIVSLTSFPERIPEININIYSLIKQTTQPDMLILWLAVEQFPNKEDDLPQNLLELKKFGLTISWCHDIKSYKKLILTLKQYPDDIIVTADDDIYYPEDWLEKLYSSYLEEPHSIHCHRMHQITFASSGEMQDYNEWSKCISNSQASYLNFFTGAGGVLYPPHCLFKDVCNEELFKKLCPTADDIWFWAMAVLNGTKIRSPKNNLKKLIYIYPEIEYRLEDGASLYRINLQANNQQLVNVMEFYANHDLLERLTQSSLVG